MTAKRTKRGSSDKKQTVDHRISTPYEKRYILGLTSALFILVLLKITGLPVLSRGWIVTTIGWILKLYTFPFIIGLMVLPLAFIAARKNEKRRKEILDLIYVFCLMSPAYLANLLNSYADQILPSLARVLGLYGMRGVIFSIVIGFGFCAHAWKRTDQYTYGMGEVVFACMATAFIAFRMVPGQKMLSEWVALGGTAYVVARGMNNIAEAKAKLAKVASA